MNNYIPQLLKTPTANLQAQKEYLFFEFALKIAHNKTEMQTFCSSQRLVNWFNDQYSILENEFLYKISNGKLFYKSEMELRSLYNTNTRKVLNTYPARILLEIRKTQKTSPQTYSKYHLN